MKLTYRGIEYNTHANDVATSTVEQTGTYRGVAFCLSQRSAPSQHVSQPMKYRGIAIGE